MTDTEKTVRGTMSFSFTLVNEPFARAEVLAIFERAVNDIRNIHGGTVFVPAGSTSVTGSVNVPFTGWTDSELSVRK